MSAPCDHETPKVEMVRKALASARLIGLSAAFVKIVGVVEGSESSELPLVLVA